MSSSFPAGVPRLARLRGKPDEAWIRDALREAVEVSDGERVRAAAAGRTHGGCRRDVAARGIPAPKLGPARRARLTDSERELYFWILRRFATRGRPSSTKMREEAARLGADVEEVLASLAREDLVHLALRW